MLCDSGRIALILPVENLKELDIQINNHDLQVLRRTDVITLEGQTPKRFTIELVRYKVDNHKFNTITLENKVYQRTLEYQELTKDFYLD
jgi:tRNA1Val (adenine37-N6)-methyltransferase